MTTISASSTIGVYLHAPAYTNPVVITAGVSVTGDYRGDAIYASAGSWTITNAGTVAGTGLGVGGIDLGAGGAVTNLASGVIGLPASNSSDIYISGGTGAVTNYGIINAGVWLQNGGTVTNLAAARIDSSDTSGGYGVGLNSGGTVINAGEISGLYVGIDASHLGGTVANQTGGTITGPYVGVLMGVVDYPSVGGRHVINQAGATISGDTGVFAGVNVATVINAGSISGTFATSITRGSISLVLGAGVSLGSGGTVTNQSGGRISGASHGVFISYAAGTVVNYGKISGGPSGFGIGFLAGGLASNAATGMISAVGRSAVYFTGAAGTVLNAGQIIAAGTASSRGVALYAGGYLSNSATGTISATGNGNAVRVQAAAGTIVNAGTLSSNFTGRSALAFQSGGFVRNVAGGLIQGGAWNGIYGTGGATTIVNAGTIVGNGSGANNGIQLFAGGSITNAAGGTISAPFKTAIYVKGGAGTVVNAGIISSGTSGAVGFAAGFANRVIDDPGAAFIGTVDGGNTLGATAVSTLELASGATVGTVSGLGTQFVNFGSIDFDSAASWFISGNTTGLAGTISGFASGDTIEVTGITVTGSGYAGGVLTLNEASGSVALTLPGSFTTSDFVVVNVASGADVSLAAPCFVAGTRIHTERGAVPVEKLVKGEHLPVLLGGKPQPIVWLGHRWVDCRHHPDPKQVWPVCVSADAFGPGQPLRDLWLSPDHALFVNDVLIPVRHLVNGKTIVQQARDEVSYWHIELPAHNVLYAEGMPVESYLDTGKRSAFANGGAAIDLRADFASQVWDTMGCAPLVLHGRQLAIAKRRLLAQATVLGHATTRDPRLNVSAEGRPLRPAIDGPTWHVCLPNGTRNVRLISRVWNPAYMTPDSIDARSFGVAISQLRLDEHEIALDDWRLTRGWHAPEQHCRWTDGEGWIVTEDARDLTFELTLTGSYWWEEVGDRARALSVAIE